MNKMLLFLAISPLLFLVDQKEKVATSIFLSPPGTVINASRDSGFVYLANLALQREDELFLVFLPQKEIWVTMTVKRNFNSAEINLDLLDSILVEEEAIELWHNHSGIDLEYYDVKDSLYWIVPSPADMFQVYHCLEQKPDIKVSGVVVTQYGALRFSTSDGPISFWNGVVYDNFSFLESEGRHMQYLVENASPNDLDELASSYRGVFSLDFEKIP
jgi:hypothetical protein